MGGNGFYSNAEAWAFEILRQKLMKEAQISTQQAFMELSALKSLLGQGQFIFCIPLGQMNNPMPFPFHLMQPTPPLWNLDSNIVSTFDPNRCFLPPLPPPPPSPALPNCTFSNPPSLSPPCQNANQQSVVRVNVKNPQNNLPANKIDECNIGKDGINVTIDLRDYLPAEISLDVEEKSLEIKACHIHAQGTKTFSRRYDLPASILLDSVRYVLSHDGYLLFSAAWIKME